MYVFYTNVVCYSRDCERTEGDQINVYFIPQANTSARAPAAGAPLLPIITTAPLPTFCCSSWSISWHHFSSVSDDEEKHNKRNHPAALGGERETSCIVEIQVKSERRANGRGKLFHPVAKQNFSDER